MKERRNYTRYKFLVEFTVVARKKEISVQGFDLSEGGISFIGTEAIPEGETCMVNLKLFSLHRTGRVISAAAMDKFPGMIKYGVEFDSPIERKQFLDYMALYQDMNPS